MNWAALLEEVSNKKDLKRLVDDPRNSKRAAVASGGWELLICGDNKMDHLPGAIVLLDLADETENDLTASLSLAIIMNLPTRTGWCIILNLDTQQIEGVNIKTLMDDKKAYVA